MAKTPKPKIGRPPGKRSNVNYSQRSLWLPKALYARVAHKLITADGHRYEFSALVTDLLEDWLSKGGKLQ